MPPDAPDFAALATESHLRVSAAAFMDEREAVQRLLAAVSALSALDGAIAEATSAYVDTLRARPAQGGIEAFLQEYGLDTREGVAIMCLAEALLRIPDAATADALIHDKLGGAQWERHLGKSESFFVNASSWGLLLTGKIVRLNDAPSVLGSLTSRLGEPVIREALKAAMRFVGGQFVLGETIESAMQNAAPWSQKGFRFSYDILGEGARTQAQAEAYVDAYRHAIARLGAQAKGLPLYDAPGISIKLSALHPRYQLTQHARVMGELLPRLKEIVLLAKTHNLTVAIDAEESTRLDIEMLVFADLFADPELAGWEGLGFVVQAYQKRAPALIDFLCDLSRRHNKKMPLRLVKGAYWDAEIKAAQLQGLPSYPVFTRKEYTDLSMLACVDKIFRNADCFYPQFGTHNARTVASIEALAGRYGVETFEFQRLHGMGEALHDKAVERHRCRIYAPVGTHRDLLAYLIRRLLENSANSSFVHLLMDEDISLERLLENPVAKAQLACDADEAAIPLPRDLYGARKNSSGRDLGNLAMVVALQRSLAACARNKPESVADISDISPMLDTACAAFSAWSQTPVEARASLLESVADALEARMEEAVCLLAHEAGKTVADGIAEVREAADYCRYYAQQAKVLMRAETLAGPTGESNRAEMHPRGVFCCISPWNFPLAIFTGQIAAALATGNCAIAKPAEQTPAIAAWMVALMHRAGIPRSVLQLAPGRGETIGAALVEDARVKGVVFTGSFETARAINRALAARDGAIVPFIAETGGLNCMVVDSSALIEQAVDDIVLSAFGSAGQRCSSLRVLYVQEDIADALIAMLAGAMADMALGDPLAFSTDIGRVIDRDAHALLTRHIERMKAEAKLLATVTNPESTMKGGLFIAPHLFEIASIDILEKEVFGSVLHLIRFKASAIASLPDAINRSGYGLTFGIHSRIEEHVRLFTSRIRAGNVYVNRSMIGATVGVQPFGGEGLSGTGPKAGGAHYLLKFLTERTVTSNTAAIGGNLALLLQ